MSRRAGKVPEPARAGPDRGRRAVAAVVGAGVVVLAIASTAGAEAPARQGWWSRLSTGSVTAPPPPDVPADGLLVQGAPDGASAVAALRFELANDAGPGTLTLTTAASPYGPVGACPLTGAAATFASTSNGAWADAPVTTCDKPITGKVDGATMTFDLSTLAGSTVAVALVPLSPATHVPFAKPGPTSLSTVPAPGADDSASDTAAAGSYDSGPSPSAYSASDAASPTPGSGPNYGAAAGGGLDPASTPVASPITPYDTARPAPAPSPSTGAGTPGRSTTQGAAAAPAGTNRARSDAQSRVGGVFAIALLVVALLAYARGHGLLGARLEDTATPSRSAAAGGS